ncbi:MAG: polyhydroxyalkanoate synthesis regulator DNA-binding domain-containing protein [Candidatus Dormibacteria bacterium]
MDTQASGPRLIKKYSNRKLYDTRSRRYITLNKIGDLLREGEEIQVVDRSSGEDLTAVTLSQVLLDSERKRTAVAPDNVLHQLVRGPEALLGAVRQSISAGQDLIQEAQVRARQPEQAVEEAIERTMHGLRLPSQREMRRLDRRLDDLNQRVDALAAAVEKLASAPKRTRT